MGGDLILDLDICDDKCGAKCEDSRNKLGLTVGATV